jgi:hypothetical protein
MTAPGGRLDFEFVARSGLRDSFGKQTGDSEPGTGLEGRLSKHAAAWQRIRELHAEHFGL